MCTNNEGFLYPVVDTEHCIDCALCLKICPWRTVREIPGRVIPPRVHAAWNLDQNIRHKSSSGGVFTALAQEVILRGGAIVGAAFDEQLYLRHIIVEDGDGLGRLRGSKYVQSEISTDLYPQIRNFLEQEREVLFSGTPCQVAGLQNFLGQDFNNLFCCDLICHGVPSPGWFNKYLQSLRKGTLAITSFTFRDKQRGWKKSGIKKTWADGSSSFQSLSAEPFLASFLRNYCLRESCYTCQFASTSRQGDITLADYWGVATKYPKYDQDDKGTSLLLINTQKGQVWLDRCKQTLLVGCADLKHAVTGNPHLIQPPSRPLERESFFDDMGKITVSELICKYKLYPSPKPSFGPRLAGYIKRRLKMYFSAA
jgi:ferredoxin